MYVYVHVCVDGGASYVASMFEKERGKEWVAGYNTVPKQNPTHVTCNVTCTCTYM